MSVLNINDKQEVSYCIPLWLRDIQIESSTARIKDRVQAYDGTRSDSVAVVAFGPSLNDTWEKVKDFKYIISCSGSHKFLVDRGIIPTHHVEVDPRPHKVQLIGTPHKDVEYVIASTCHAKVFDHLDGFNVKLWHVFDPKEDGIRSLPPGEWALTGGCSVGLRCLSYARFMGFTNLHVFGMDGCEGATGKHADVHPMQAKGHSTVEYKGVTYRTSPSMLACAQQTPHEVDQLLDVTATFYGEGLVQAMMLDYVRKVDAPPALLAFYKPELISKEYAELNAKLHMDNPGYGVGGGRHAETVKKMMKGLDSCLDYGSGKGLLAKALPFPIWEYDPAIPGKDAPPRPSDLVVCLDVLEHIEQDKLHHVLADLRRCTLKIGYFVIHIGPSRKTLADGRNAHLIQKPMKWWHSKIRRHFEIPKIVQVGVHVHVIVAPLSGKSKIIGKKLVTQGSGP